MVTATRQQRTETSSEAPPSDGLSRFIGAGAWAAMAGGSAMVFKIGWTFLFGTEAGAVSHLPAALLGLVVCDVLVLYTMRRLRGRSAEPSRPAGHHG